MKKNLQALCAGIVCAAMMTACSSENDFERQVLNPAGEQTEVTLTFEPYEVSAMSRGITDEEAAGTEAVSPLAAAATDERGAAARTAGRTTRAATSISGIVTRLDVWISEDGTLVEEVHQTSTDDGFGTVSVSLNRLKTYTLVAVGHKASGAATLTDGVIAFPDEKVTHAMIYTTTFCPGTTASLNCVMTRIVGMLRFEIADQVPDEAYTMRFSLGESFTRWNVTSAIGTNAIERTSTFNNFSRANDGTAAFTVYVMPSNLTDTDHLDITVTALKENGDEIEAKTFSDVPIKAGYKTTYHGQFFTTEAMTMSFTCEDWSEFDVVEY